MKEIRAFYICGMKNALEQLLIVQFICDVEQRTKKIIITTIKHTEIYEKKESRRIARSVQSLATPNRFELHERYTEQFIIRESSTDNNISNELGSM